MKKVIVLLLIYSVFGCKPESKTMAETDYLKFSENILDYHITPKDSIDKSGLMFSDQGAWFAYSLTKTNRGLIGFSGPFLMTQDNGIWSSGILSGILLTTGHHNDNLLSLKEDLVEQSSSSSHLHRIFQNEKLKLEQSLVFLSGHTALQKVIITNITDDTILVSANIQGGISNIGIELSNENNEIKLTSKNSEAVGYIDTLNKIERIDILDENRFYVIQLESSFLDPNESKEIIISQTFIFPEYSWEKEKALIERVDFDSILNARKQEKNKQLKSLIDNRKPQFQDDKYAEVLAKAHLTLQNNWRIPAGEIEHEGLFPSYHYKWFNGFWSWDSWKHAVGLSYYDLRLAKEQVKLMFKFQNGDGFVADCVYRDTTIEAHNYRDTKPPLSAWAVAKIYEKDKDLEFVKYMYPKLKKYHYWWYNKRDHDQDGLCEYGSTDGSLIAAKWESGMDNAIRFDDSKILKNEEGAYSLDQESVDLNAYLYAEKLFLSQLSEALNLNDASQYKSEAESLKVKIQIQFYDENDGWFYDTNLEGTQFIKGEGSEGWTALWANAATQEQAAAVKNKMMNPNKFYTKVPFQTMSADHEKFDPLKGYWRGPNWLDQAYFGTKGLRNYGFNEEADKAIIQILEGAEGLLGKGKSIRENYHPLTGEGLHAENFSWSAAHVIMLLMNETND
ncbi:trehalase [Flavobacteriaceae bacterium S0862]|nr:trehalase [Flavobacteriaceae bacterium S0862]